MAVVEAVNPDDCFTHRFHFRTSESARNTPSVMTSFGQLLHHEGVHCLDGFAVFRLHEQSAVADFEMKHNLPTHIISNH